MTKVSTTSPASSEDKFTMLLDGVRKSFEKAGKESEKERKDATGPDQRFGGGAQKEAIVKRKGQYGQSKLKSPTERAMKKKGFKVKGKR